MCVIFWTTEHEEYDLVIASNRDEFLARPTLSAQWHSFDLNPENGQGDVLSARDSTGGGTWLGLTRSGAFATLTNFTEDKSAPLPQGITAFESRGQLVRDWLTLPRTQSSSAEEQVRTYLTGLAGKLDRYPGFNLLVGTVSAQGTVVGYITNRTPEGGLCANRKPDLFLPGTTAATQGMSNSVLAQPWTKVRTGCSAFESALTSSKEDELVEKLFDLLWTTSDPPPVQRSELRNSVLVPPLVMQAPTEWYGTRTSTVILITKTGQARLVERDAYALESGSPRLINGPPPSAIHGRSSGQRSYTYTLR